MLIISMPCGHSGDFHAFCSTTISGDLPPDTWQCPVCNRAFRRVHGTPEVMESGFVMPGKVSIMEVEARL